MICYELFCSLYLHLFFKIVLKNVNVGYRRRLLNECKTKIVLNTWKEVMEVKLLLIKGINKDVLSYSYVKISGMIWVVRLSYLG